jgi:sulfonate transport system substrate-binding protein
MSQELRASSIPYRRHTRVGLAAIALVLALAGCGSSSSHARTPADESPSSAASGAVAGAAAVTVPATVPPGTTLRVGDQLEFLQTILATTGLDKDLPYKLKWAGFIGGPPMLQAFHADAIDAGFVADTPLIFAQAAHQDVVAIAAWASEHGGAELIAAPNSGINGWADLKGKKVAFQKGTSAEATILQGLKGAGLGLGDINAVDLPITQISAALQGGSVRAGVLVAPLDTAYLKSNPGAKVVDRPGNLTARVSFLIASKQAIDDPAKAAALRDYIVRFGKALAKIKANPDDFVKRFYVAKYGLTLAAGKALLAQLGSSSFIALSGDLIPAQQDLADLYHDAGEIPDKVDASKEFDNRFADAIRQAASG